jgi:hypothetical protein
MNLGAIDNLTLADLEARLRQGGRLVIYEYCISFLAVTLRKPSAVILVGPNGRGFVRGLPYTLLSLLLGWWGLPWGLVYTPLAVITNVTGGRNVTAEVWAFLQR